MLTIQDVNSAIISGEFTNEQLNSISDAIRFARNQMIQKNTGSMVIGTNVKFTHPRTGQVVQGIVKKVNRKYIMVSENGSVLGNWRVPANMLTVA